MVFGIYQKCNVDTYAAAILAQLKIQFKKQVTYPRHREEEPQNNNNHKHIGHGLLKVLLPQGELCRLCFSLHITSKDFLQHVGHLVVGAFGCYSVLNTLPLFF